MALASLAFIGGLVLLIWSADKFVSGAASTARHFGMPSLLIGMVILGFGTSAPEMIISALSSFQGNPGLALGNAYGSNITNITLILGMTALIMPITVHSQVLKKELPVLVGITLLSAWQIWDGFLSFWDAAVLLVVFGLLMTWSIKQGMGKKEDSLGLEAEQELSEERLPLSWSVFWLLAGLATLILSSRLLVWGAVEIAKGFGVSDLIIGLTIVAIGTSLPELASSIAAARKGEHDIAMGNVLGSNLFNTLAVVGIAGTIQPMQVEPDVLSRDMLLMLGLTLSLFVLGFRPKKQRCINRWEGSALLICYTAYIVYIGVLFLS